MKDIFMTALLGHLETLKSLLDKNDMAAAQVLVDLLIQEERDGLDIYQKEATALDEKLDLLENNQRATSKKLDALLQRLGRSSVP